MASTSSSSSSSSSSNISELAIQLQPHKLEQQQQQLNDLMQSAQASDKQKLGFAGVGPLVANPNSNSWPSNLSSIVNSTTSNTGTNTNSIPKQIAKPNK